PAPPGRRFVTDSGKEPQVVTLGAVGKAALALSVGAVGVLAGNKVRDARYVDGIWQSLEQAGSSGEIFTEEMVAALPDVARRYFLHAIQPGVPLASRLHWRYTGSLKPGKDLPWMAGRLHLVRSSVGRGRRGGEAGQEAAQIGVIEGGAEAFGRQTAAV